MNGSKVNFYDRKNEVGTPVDIIETKKQFNESIFQMEVSLKRSL